MDDIYSQLHMDGRSDRYPKTQGDLRISVNEWGADEACWMNHRGVVVHGKVEAVLVCMGCGQVYVVNVN